MKLLAAAALATLVLAPAVQAQPMALQQVTTALRNAEGKEIGVVRLTAAPKGVVLRVEANGLTPGWHGIHFHEKADCSKSDFTTAGGHTHAGGERVHGLLNPKANETGDLPNVFADAHGMVMAEVFSGLTTLRALMDGDGSAVVIHANPDDQMAQPIGGAGPRVACAAIR
jgi:superoxide dismutase, Cu-Zn family